MAFDLRLDFAPRLQQPFVGLLLLHPILPKSHSVAGIGGRLTMKEVSRYLRGYFEDCHPAKHSSALAKQ
jgi:hypothetical protein